MARTFLASATDAYMRRCPEPALTSLRVQLSVSAFFRPELVPFDLAVRQCSLEGCNSGGGDFRILDVEDLQKPGVLQRCQIRDQSVVAIERPKVHSLQR